MSILKKLNDLSIQYRKSSDNKDKGVFLSTIISEAKNIAKKNTVNGVTPELNDVHAELALKKFLSMADDILRFGKEYHGYDNAFEEKNLILSILPEMVSDDEIKNEVANYIARFITTNGSIDKRGPFVGTMIKHLSDKYGTRFDKKNAAAIINQHLNEVGVK